MEFTFYWNWLKMLNKQITDNWNTVVFQFVVKCSVEKYWIGEGEGMPWMIQLLKNIYLFTSWVLFQHEGSSVFITAFKLSCGMWSSSLLLNCSVVSDSFHQASLSFTVSQSLLKFMFIELVMPSNHLILCPFLLLLPSIIPNIRVFSNESALVIKVLDSQLQHQSFQWILRDQPRLPSLGVQSLSHWTTREVLRIQFQILWSGGPSLKLWFWRVRNDLRKEVMCIIHDVKSERLRKDHYWCVEGLARWPRWLQGDKNEQVVGVKGPAYV